MKKPLLFASAVFSLLAFGHPAQAQNVISVNFTGDTGSGDGSPNFLSFNQSAGVVPAANYNDAHGFMAGQINDVTDNTGNVVNGLSISYSGASEGTNGATATTPNQALLDGFIASTGSTPASATVSTLPAGFGTYNLYVYLTDAAASTGTYTFEAGLLDTNGVFVGNPTTTLTQTAQAETTPSDTFTPATATTAGNFLVFSGLTASTFQLAATSAAGMAPIDGFQIVGNAPVPEASTLVSTSLLLALGGVLAATRRRRSTAGC